MENNNRLINLTNNINYYGIKYVGFLLNYTIPIADKLDQRYHLTQNKTLWKSINSIARNINYYGIKYTSLILNYNKS